MDEMRDDKLGLSCEVERVFGLTTTCLLIEAFKPQDGNCSWL